MPKKDDILKDICKREFDNKLYDIEANSISIYNVVRRSCRDKMMSLYGYGENLRVKRDSANECRMTFLKSLWQLTKIAITGRKSENLIRSFERIEKVDNLYVDKFTDPLIDFSAIGDSFIIFEQARTGKHLTPRIHEADVIYTDCIYRIAHHLLPIIKRQYLKKYNPQVCRLLSTIETTFPEIEINKEEITNSIIENDFCIHIFVVLFRRLCIKRLFSPARGSFMHMIPAAKKLGIKVYELQHGVTYSESLTYSGYNDPMFTPDFFLSFSKINNAWCYGITENKIIEIGWAFENYLNIEHSDYNIQNKVLVISSPAISKQMVAITCLLASSNQHIHFCFRPHPNEQIDSEGLNRMKKYPNITIDNNLENISVTLMRFDNVIGENSTVLYEALSMGKKVGKLCMEGFEPQYLKREDMACFYEIANNSDFVEFINAPLEEKPSMKIYTPFKPEVVNNLLQ